MRINQPWLQLPALQKVLQALIQAGGEVRAVGGCVRDSLLGRAVHEIDLATSLLPDAVIAAAQSAGLKAVPTGLAHGTVTLVSDKIGFEVTTLRKDVKTDGRRAEVAFTRDWEEDAARRDFTINAMSCTPDGEVFDYFGGHDDLVAGRIRFVGNPLQRIREDVLRILRFYRFQAYFGKGEADGAALIGCSMLAPLLPKLARERVRSELLKLLIAPDPLPVWRLLQEGGALAALQLPLGNRDRLHSVVQLERILGASAPVTPLRRLAAVCNPDVEYHFLASELRFSTADRNRLCGMGQHLLLCNDTHRLLRLAYRHTSQLVLDLLILNNMATPALAQLLTTWQRPQFPLSGKDALAAGFPSGPRLGETLRAVEDWWVQHNFAPDAQACLARLGGA